ncbi:MAG: UDP-N-acetylglucosamine 1-carboxyvinyltransferase [Lachnospiraceae bacterium]|nr:UDP-N-acetylglucosamine 1-carboxyvinyltransferase [Lachnospiraceae bacterium]
MGAIHIHGGIPLQGQVMIQGSKNAALPILAASILTKGSNLFSGCPRIADVEQMQMLLRSLGCVVRWEGDKMRVDAHRVCSGSMPREAVTGMRSSLTLLGAMLGRCGQIFLEQPGGCVIGSRPINLHIDALEKMNVKFARGDSILYACTEGLKGAEIHLACPSVGATENIILAAVLADGCTVIHNAAAEPEIVALCAYLNVCGAHIEGAGTACIRIEGVKELTGSAFEIPADRIVAGTYLFACLAAGGSVFLERAPVKEMKAVLEVARALGAGLQCTGTGLYVQAPNTVKSVPCVRTAVYPGFPTDLQSPLLAVLAGGMGKSIVEERIFEDRFRVVPELLRMGAKIRVEEDKTAYVEGQECLRGARVTAGELRGGAALVVAGLGASGETIVEGKKYIDRGYENICRDLRELGARIYSV